MSNRTKQFLALALIGRIEEIQGELAFMGMEKLKGAAQELLKDAQGGGFMALYSLFESVSRTEPTLGSEITREVLNRALDVAKKELVAITSDASLEKEVG